MCIQQLDQKLQSIKDEYSTLYDEYKEREKNKQNLSWILLSPVPLNHHQQYSQNLNKHRVCTNWFFDKSLEGKQARKYRQNCASITSPIAPSNYYRYTCQSIKYYDQLMQILNQQIS